MPLPRSEQAHVNGARSRGPKTPEGKARSSQNSLKHGVFGRVAVLNCESADQFELFRQDYFNRFRPSDEPEANLVEKIIFCTWRQHRLWDIEHGLLEKEMNSGDPGYPLDVPENSLRLAEAFARGLSTPDALDRLSRMEASLDRQASRAYHRLHLLQKDRPPKPDTQNPQNEPDGAASASERVTEPPSGAGFSLREASASPTKNPQNEPSPGPHQKPGPLPQPTPDTSDSHNSERTVPDFSGPPPPAPLEESGTVPQHTSDTPDSHNSGRTVPDFSGHPNRAASESERVTP